MVISRDLIQELKRHDFYFLVGHKSGVTVLFRPQSHTMFLNGSDSIGHEVFLKF